MISLACPDWEQSLLARQSLIPPDLPIDMTRGGRAVGIFDKLRLADVPGTPTMREAAGDWFREIVRHLFGAMDPVTHARWIRELFLLVPKKNSKTTNGALLMLTALLMNTRPRAPLIMTGPTHDITELAYNAAAGAIDLDPVLRKLLHPRDHLKTITHRQTGAELSLMTFDPAVLTGQKAVAVLIDELHVLGRMKKAASAIRQLRGGMVPYPEAFLAFITTQSEEAPAGVFATELQRARGIRDGRIEGEMLPVLYELPQAIQQDPEAWRDTTIWPAVTPNLGRSVAIEALERGYRDSVQAGEAELRGWASQHLNVEIGVALLANAWPGAPFWETCGVAALSLEDLLARSEVVTIGIDGGGLDDLLGFGVIGRCATTRRWLHWAHAWAHPSVLERRKDEAARFRDFEADGDLTIVDQVGDDVDEVAELAAIVWNSGLMDHIGVDPAGLGGILDALVDPDAGAGIPEDRVVGISQGWRLMGAIKTVERKLAAGDFEHGGTRLMAWCVGNAKVVPVGNAINITKQASGSAKIDPLMATFNAADLMGRNPQALGNVGDFLASPVNGA